jgi:hypothetical protein
LVNEDRVSLVDVEWSIPVTPGIIDTPNGVWQTMPTEEFTVGGHMSERSSVYGLGAVYAQLALGKSLFHINRSDIPDNDRRRSAIRRLHNDFDGVVLDDPELSYKLSASLKTV